eukprot:4588846-Heterocapsa_arctica.AAC.1
MAPDTTAGGARARDTSSALADAPMRRRVAHTHTRADKGSSQVSVPRPRAPPMQKVAPPKG